VRIVALSLPGVDSGESFSFYQNSQKLKIMNNEHIPTIHDLDFNLICEYYLRFDRQGPGNREMTLRALNFIDGLTAGSHIADLGCGTGGQTMTLAAATPAHITGLDLFPAFIDRFNEQAWEHGVRDRAQGVVGSMDALPFAERSLDLIWCEGAIYNIGFERGLNYWRQFLRPGGYVAVTENTWFTDERPAEIADFWNAAYPEIDTIPAKIAAMQLAGYEFVAAFALPESVWADFYNSQDGALEAFARDHPGNPAAEALVATERHERALWEKYKAYYGYVFYIGRRRI
jgi:SAM-dependent methyltransferase